MILNVENNINKKQQATTNTIQSKMQNLPNEIISKIAKQLEY
ncbi:MAG: hypothetical protein NZZ41_06675 [Candidatus Dojkabacteria bacterium]|nr:hypothetical protein [Candidatus Dojkabacteria bacterium]